MKLRTFVKLSTSMKRCANLKLNASVTLIVHWNLMLLRNSLPSPLSLSLPEIHHECWHSLANSLHQTLLFTFHICFYDCLVILCKLKSIFQTTKSVLPVCISAARTPSVSTHEAHTSVSVKRATRARECHALVGTPLLIFSAQTGFNYCHYGAQLRIFDAPKADVYQCLGLYMLRW